MGVRADVKVDADLTAQLRALRGPILGRLCDRVALDEDQMLAVGAAITEATSAGYQAGVGEALATVREQLAAHGVDVRPHVRAFEEEDPWLVS